MTEREGGRDDVLNDLAGRVRDHYISHEEIAWFIETLGFPKAAECIREILPTKPIGRSSDLGEILAAEFVEEQLDFKVPVKRLRYKDHRNMPMRGDDIIAATHDERHRLHLLKGEAKSAQRLSEATVAKARSRLEENYGRPSADTLTFIARKLMRCENPALQQLGEDILKEAADSTVPKSRIAHLVFTLCGNRARNIVRDDWGAADAGRAQHSVNVQIENHREFVNIVYEEASSIGND